MLIEGWGQGIGGISTIREFLASGGETQPQSGKESTAVGDCGAGPAGLLDCSQGEEVGWRKVCKVQGQQYLPGASFSGCPSRLGGLVPAVGLLPEVRVEGSS